MHIHPFVLRLRTERRVLKVINSIPFLTTTPLPGLAPQTIDRWIAEALPRSIRSAWRDALRTVLIDISARLRLGSAASHRGALPEASASERLIDIEVARLQSLLAEFSLANEQPRINIQSS